MTVDHERDALLGALGALCSPSPTAARDARIQARCHAAMTRRTPPLGGWSWPRVFRRASGSIVDALLAAAVGLYGVVTVAEAFKAAGLF